MLFRTVGSHGLSLRGRRGVLGPTGPLAVFHLDSVKRWNRDNPGLEPHESQRWMRRRAGRRRRQSLKSLIECVMVELWVATAIEAGMVLGVSSVRSERRKSGRCGPCLRSSRQGTARGR